MFRLTISASPIKQRQLFDRRLARFNRVLLVKYEDTVRQLELRIPRERSDRLYRCRNILMALRQKVAGKMVEIRDHLKLDPSAGARVPKDRVRLLVESIVRLTGAVNKMIAQVDADYGQRKHCHSHDYRVEESKVRGVRTIDRFNELLSGPDDGSLRETFGKIVKE